MSGGRHEEEEVRRGGKCGDRQANPYIYPHTVETTSHLIWLVKSAAVTPSCGVKMRCHSYLLRDGMDRM